tara:strand:+ start:260 stop:529 length:270 start_codon:yes stop_codon:yes gene_type:complete
MGFDLTGYEEDNMDVRPLATYTIGAIIALAVVIVGIYYYMFFMGEKYIQELFLERDTMQTLEYNKQKTEFLSSSELKTGIEKALKSYNE